jgi:hypothetical protein
MQTEFHSHLHFKILKTMIQKTLLLYECEMKIQGHLEHYTVSLGKHFQVLSKYHNAFIFKVKQTFLIA